MQTHRLIFAMLGLLLGAGGAHAQQQFPAKPIRLIVPFPPGGLADIVERMLAPKPTETFKQSVVVDNRPGSGCTIGVETAGWVAVLGPKGAAQGYRHALEQGVRLHPATARRERESAGGSPERFREVLKRDVAKWQKVVKIASIKPGS